MDATQICEDFEVSAHAAVARATGNVDEQVL